MSLINEKANKIKIYLHNLHTSHNFLKEKLTKLNKYANNKLSKCH